MKDHTLKRAGPVAINLTTLAYNPSSQIVSRSVTVGSYQTALPSGSPAQYTPNNLNQYSFVDVSNSLNYDLNGNLTGYDGWTYAFDAHNRMKSANGPGTSLTLAYDPTGRLHSTTFGGSTTEYLYSGNQMIGEYTDTGSPINLYVYPPASDIPIARFSGTQGLNDFQYLRSDERGSIVAVTDDIVLESHQYDVYGVPLDGSDSLFRYTGQILLPGTELYHYKARVYRPSLGRFMQTDPIGYDDGMNMYAYVGNDPMNMRDPSGLCADDACADRVAEGVRNFAAVNPEAAAVVGMVGAGVMVSISAAIAGPSIVAAVLENPATISEATVTAGEIAAGDAAGPGLALGAAAVARGTTELSKSAQKGIRSLERRIEEHEKKLADFKANPTVRSGMEGQPESVIKAAQDSRTRHLEKEIQTFKENIEKLKGGQ